MEKQFFVLQAIKSTKHFQPQKNINNDSFGDLCDEDSKKTLQFHVKNGDYVRTLITILRFFEEIIMNDASITNEERENRIFMMQKVISDLFYLNDNYKIIPKTDDSKKSN